LLLARQIDQCGWIIGRDRPGTGRRRGIWAKSHGPLGTLGPDLPGSWGASLGARDLGGGLMEQPVTRASLGDDARRVASAARDLVRAIENVGDVEEAVDALEACARQAVDVTVHGFDAGQAGEPDPEDMLAVALTQLEIGNTLLAAQRALTASGKAPRLDSAATSLEDAADVTDFLWAAAPGMYGFDGARAAVMNLPDTAFAALDAMAAAAADVTTDLLGKALTPAVDRVPDSRIDLADLCVDIPGRLARWGAQAVRQGLKLLAAVVSPQAVERARDRIDEVLARLGHDDRLVLAGWAIGADSVRDRLAECVLSNESRDSGGAEGEIARVAADLSRLADRFGRLCRMLRRVAIAMVDLAATMAMVSVTIPHPALLTTSLLVLVIAAVVLLGCEYTGAWDLPGPASGVLLVAIGGRSPKLGDPNSPSLAAGLTPVLA
jgi:hypothetical protein